ncbi:MAG: lysophospholipid acyltransferase family protein [Bacteroidales bacterium]|nr:lysophospholipid acyltransferase family protein [Bacteroidales bacterium]
MKYIGYIFFRLFVLKIALMPFPVMYVFSDFLAFVLRDVLNYRKKIVYDNMHQSFPDKTESEIEILVHGFYRNLSDIILESIKGFTMSEKELHKRYHFQNTHILNGLCNKGAHVICAGGHYGNWEWGVLIMGKQVDHQVYGVYKPLANKYIDNYIKRKRSKLGSILITMDDTIRVMRSAHQKPPVYVLISDQSPSSHKKAIWVDFLNRKTATIPGVESASKLFTMPVVYLVPIRKKRGYYDVHSELIIENPQEHEKGMITQILMSRLEKDIINLPENWLWSHRRWKHKYNQEILNK